MIINKNIAKSFVLIIVFVILIAIIVPVISKAYVLDLNILKDIANKGERINFTALIQPEASDKENITSIQLKLSGPLETICTFKPNGEAIKGCNGITIKKASELKYNITYDTLVFFAGTYKTSLSVFSGNKSLNSVSGKNLKIISPLSLSVMKIQDKEVFGSKDFYISLNASDKSLFYYSEADNPERWIKICSILNISCSKKIRLFDGVNHLLFKAVDINGISSNIEELNFTIDSAKPIIIKTSSNGMITNGSIFSVVYTKYDRLTGQEKLNNVTLFYGVEGNIISISKINECLTGINKNCEFKNIDVSRFNGQTITYWFNVSTKANSALSRKSRTIVDTTPPEIRPLADNVNLIIFGNVYPDSRNQVNYRKVKFILDINENNFHSVKYADTNNCGYQIIPSQILCTRLDVGRCIVTKNFCIGSHSLNITAIDKAGNAGTIQASFNIEP